MTLAAEIDKIREMIKQIEDPAAATAIRHVCKALEEIRGEAGTAGTSVGRERESSQRPQ